jgi:hypothetical protein
MTATYWTQVSKALLGDNPVWQDAGMELLASRGPLGSDVMLCQFRDPAAPPQLEGRRVDPLLARVDGRPVVTGYALLGDEGQVVARLRPLTPADRGGWALPARLAAPARDGLARLAGADKAVRRGRACGDF